MLPDQLFACILVLATAGDVALGGGGDPLANLKVAEDPTKDFLVITKDGKVYKISLE